MAASLALTITMNSECSSEPVRVGLVGACGRMGQMLVKRILATEGMTVSAAFDLVNIGRDIGEVVGAGALGVPVSDSKDLAQVLKDSRTDVLLDFTIAKATAVNASSSAPPASATRSSRASPTPSPGTTSRP